MNDFFRDEQLRDETGIEFFELARTQHEITSNNISTQSQNLDRRKKSISTKTVNIWVAQGTLKKPVQHFFNEVSFIEVDTKNCFKHTT